MSSATKQFSASSTKLGSTTMSLLQKATNSPRATARPALSEKMYRFSGRGTSRTEGNCSLTAAALPSDEPLSTTMISSSGPMAASMLRTQSRRSWRSS